MQRVVHLTVTMFLLKHPFLVSVQKDNIKTMTYKKILKNLTF